MPFCAGAALVAAGAQANPTDRCSVFTPDPSYRQSFLDNRIAQLRQEILANGIDALIVGHLPNLFYLTKLRSTAGLLVLDAVKSRLHLVIDFRYETAAENLIKSGNAPRGLELTLVIGSYEETLARLLESLDAGRVGIEADHTSVYRWQWLAERTSIDLVPMLQLVERHRMIKDLEEIRVMRQAGGMLAALVQPILNVVREGQTERVVAREIDELIVAAGFERTAFETVVASGPNSALPHAYPTTRRLTPGDLVVLDFGGVLHRYNVDMSRTIAIGGVTSEAERLHRAVCEAQLAAMSVVAPGGAVDAVDEAARAVLERHQLADKFGHSTGHGLGLEIHEGPRIGRTHDDLAAVTLVPGMVFTIEPGVYVPEVGGVRIEDDVLVTDSGVDVLTPARRDLVVA